MTQQQPERDIAEYFTFQYREGGETYPFVESESADITGYGHQDRAEFAAAINRYDRESDDGWDEDDAWSADDISHGWAREHPENDELLQPCASTDAGAFPITTLWGAR